MGAEVYHNLKNLIKDKYGEWDVTREVLVGGGAHGSSTDSSTGSRTGSSRMGVHNSSTGSSAREMQQHQPW
jgi:hypothetical protein